MIKIEKFIFGKYFDYIFFGLLKNARSAIFNKI